MTALTALIDTAVGLFALSVLAVRTRGRVAGPAAHPYWKWRHDTARGGPALPPPPTSAARATLEYARWVGRMRRLR